MTRAKEGGNIVDTSKISEFLKSERSHAGLTQLSVAEKLGITPQAVSKWERGESMPDITLLPELAKIYGTGVEDILGAGVSVEDGGYGDIIRTLNAFISEGVFEKLVREFERTENAGELRVPPEIFMALNPRQRDKLLELLLEMEDFELFIGEITQYLSLPQRESLIIKTAEKGRYEALEPLIPFMTRAARDDIVAILLERGKIAFLEEMLPYLNRTQKDMIIRFFVENNLDFKPLEDFLPFMDRERREIIIGRIYDGTGKDENT